jgi:hypothetical protein
MMMVVVVIWHCMESFPSWYKEPHVATHAAIFVETTKCPHSGGTVWVKELEGHSTCEGKASNKNSLRTENVRSHDIKEIKLDIWCKMNIFFLL